MSRTAETSLNFNLAELRRLEIERVIAEAEGRAARLIADAHAQAAAERAAREAAIAEQRAAAERAVVVAEQRRLREHDVAVRIAAASCRIEAQAKAQLERERRAIDDCERKRPRATRLPRVVAVLGALLIATLALGWSSQASAARGAASTRGKIAALRDDLQAMDGLHKELGGRIADLQDVIRQLATEPAQPPQVVTKPVKKPTSPRRPPKLPPVERPPLDLEVDTVNALPPGINLR